MLQVIVPLFLFLLLAALYVKDKTPRQGLYSIAAETLKGLRLLRFPLPWLENVLHKHAPFRRHCSPYKKTRKNVSHFPLILNLPTSEDSGEATHPDVLHVPEGWSKGNWSWLMSATPYASGDDYLENPELYVSYDGFNWMPPGAEINPLASLPVDSCQRTLKKEIHSDSSLLLCGETLHLYYRWSGKRLDGSYENRIHLITSRDGLTWSEHKTLLAEKDSPERSRHFLSPSVLFMDGIYVMWTVEYEGGERSIIRRTSADGLVWSKPEKTPLISNYPLPPAWHLDVTPCAERDGLILILTAAMKDGGDNAELHYGFGDGQSWHMAGKLIEPGYFFESGRVYRSSLVSLGEGIYSLFYSAQSRNRTASVARLDLGLSSKGVFGTAVQGRLIYNIIRGREQIRRAPDGNG